MCRSALSVYSEFDDLARLFSEISLRQGNHINMENSLSPSTIPRELYESIIQESNDLNWKSLYQANIEQIPLFEESLKNRQYINMVRLATANEVRAGKIYITAPYKTHPEAAVYTAYSHLGTTSNVGNASQFLCLFLSKHSLQLTDNLF